MDPFEQKIATPAAQLLLLCLLCRGLCGFGFSLHPSSSFWSRIAATVRAGGLWQNIPEELKKDRQYASFSTTAMYVDTHGLARVSRSCASSTLSSKQYIRGEDMNC